MCADKLATAYTQDCISMTPRKHKYNMSLSPGATRTCFPPVSSCEGQQPIQRVRLPDYAHAHAVHPNNPNTQNNMYDEQKGLIEIPSVSVFLGLPIAQIKLSFGIQFGKDVG